MRSKFIAALGAFMLSAAALQAQANTGTTAPIDINTASRVQLADAGWGQYADAIIAARPYKSMNDLVEKKVVPAKAYEKGSAKFEIGKGTTTPRDPNAGNTNQTPVTPQTGVTPPAGVNPPMAQPDAPVVPTTATPAAPAPGAPTSPAK